jgi:2-keto-myo-inositol isomerase
MLERLTRREILTRAGSTAGAGLLTALAIEGKAGSAPAPAEKAAAGEPFGICLNTATLREHRLGLVADLELAARTGYQGVELWVHQLDEYEKSGGTLGDLGKRIQDLGLRIPDAIAFFEWLVNDGGRRAKGLEEARRCMDRLQKIGCARMAAPPAGKVEGVELMAAAERYRELLVVGDQTGVAPILEVWGFAPVISRLSQAALVAMEAGHPRAAILPDVFHLYKGGSGLDSIRYLSGDSIGIFHMNDYPANPPRQEIRDAQRVFPGDGVAPLRKLFQDLRQIGYRGMLSLELFNPDYYKRPAAEVAREGFQKTRALVQSSLG